MGKEKGEGGGGGEGMEGKVERLKRLSEQENSRKYGSRVIHTSNVVTHRTGFGGMIRTGSTL